jgi:hypothetical protein
VYGSRHWLPVGLIPCPEAGHYSPRCPCVRSQLTCYRAYVAAGEIAFRVAGRLLWCLVRSSHGPLLGSVALFALLLWLTTLEPTAITGRVGEPAAPFT